MKTGIIKISEVGANRKDRYTSASYGNYLVDKLEIDLFGKKKKMDFDPSKFVMSKPASLRKL